MHRCVCMQKLSHVFTIYVCVMYMSCNICTKTLLLFCVYEQRLYHVFAMYVNWSDKAKIQSIYCIVQVCRCAKAESCLCNICMYIVYEFNMWIKCCYCSVCDCTACKSIWKCEKSINLLHYIYLYMHKSWIVSLQYICICCIWVAACMQRRCCFSVYMQASMYQWLRCYCLAFQLCVNSMHE